MSALLTEPLDLYLIDLGYDSAGNETPYLFHPTNDTTRCLPSSQWTAVVKAAFKKHAGKATPPKTLRASFITWLRDSTDAPEERTPLEQTLCHSPFVDFRESHSPLLTVG